MVDDKIYIVGGLGYQKERMARKECEIYTLDIKSFKIEKMTASGDEPGPFYKNKAEYVPEEGKIYFTNCHTPHTLNPLNNDYILDLNSMQWTALPRANP